MKLAFLVIFLAAAPDSNAQLGYALHEMTDDLAVSRIINSPLQSSHFRQLNDRLTIVDFFGTWCIPCVKALPNLSILQKKYKDELRILLVSTEEEDKLNTFIKRQKNFDLPVVLDKEELFMKRFQPPSYPYTVIVDKYGKVMAIPVPGEITERNIDIWLKEQNNNVATVPIPASGMNEKILKPGNSNRSTILAPSQNKLVQLSQDFMYAAKTSEETAGFITQLRQLNMQELVSIIKTDEEKKAFWINLYNAYTQVSLTKNPEQYKKRGNFFGSRQIEIAGHSFSLDDIEHGILRRSKIKWSLGYFTKLFPGKTEKRLRVDRLDYRLHFALNCGAKSCPPIAFYIPENINTQLDLATKVYLKGEANYQESTNTVNLPALMNWFRRDFGGKRKMIDLLKRLAIIPASKNPTIKFKEYDWTLFLQNYKS